MNTFEANIPQPSQPDMRKSVDSSAKGVYLKTMKTAWEIALTPSMPHKHFSVLVKCQKINGVHLVAEKDNNKAGKWYHWQLFFFFLIFLAFFVSFVNLIQ